MSDSRQEKQMTYWLYTGKDAQGRPTQGMVDAPTAWEALAQLQETQPGLQDIQLLDTFNSAAAVSDMVSAVGADASQVELDRLARLMVAQVQRPGLATTLRQLLRQNALWFAGTGLVFVWGCIHNWSGGRLFVAALVFAAPLLLFAWLHRYTQAHDRGLRVHAVGDIPQLHAVCQRLTRAARLHAYLRSSAWDLAVHHAWHVSRTQGLEAAQRGLAAHPYRPREEKMLVVPDYLMRLARGDLQAAERVLCQALERWPEEPTLMLDLALIQARSGRGQEAQRLLARLPAQLLPSMGQPFRAWIDGLAALEAKDLTKARVQFSQACEQFMALGQNRPAIWPSLAVCTADLALCLAWSGQIRAARQVLRPVLPMVKAHLEPQRLALLQRVLR